MTLKATPTIVTPTGVAGLEFRDEADTVNALVPHLRRHGVEAIVVLVHQGGFQSSGFSDINGCDGNHGRLGTGQGRGAGCTTPSTWWSAATRTRPTTVQPTRSM